MLTPGTYTTIVPAVSRGEHALDVPVEGMRLEWDRVLPGCLPRDAAERRGFLLALTIICNSFEPDAKPRSLPVWRLQTQLDLARRRVIEEIESERGGEVTK